MSTMITAYEERVILRFSSTVLRVDGGTSAQKFDR